MSNYVPSPRGWVAEQVELYEGSGGTEGLTLPSHVHELAVTYELPVIIVSNRGRRTGATRKTPLMRAVDGDKYILVASQGGSLKHPVWYHNLKADPNIEIRDKTEVFQMRAHEVVEPAEKQRLWDLAVKAYPPFQEYQEKTQRIIPVFLAEPAG